MRFKVFLYYNTASYSTTTLHTETLMAHTSNCIASE